MTSSRNRIIASCLSALYPGTGHLFEGRYLAGTIAVVLTTWAWIVLLISVFVFNTQTGLGMWTFPIALYTIIGLWTAMLASCLLRDVRLLKGKVNRNKLYAEGYSAMLQGETDAALAVFNRLYKGRISDPAAGVMAARMLAKRGSVRRAKSVLKSIKRRIDDPLWIWRIDYTLQSLNQ